jgi:hypothetical protein
MSHVNKCILLASLLSLVVGLFTLFIGYLMGINGSDAPVTADELKKFQNKHNEKKHLSYPCLLCYANQINGSKSSLRSFRNLSYYDKSSHLSSLSTNLGSQCNHCSETENCSTPGISGGGIV